MSRKQSAESKEKKAKSSYCSPLTAHRSPKDTRSVTLSPSLLRAPIVRAVPAGLTIREIVATVSSQQSAESSYSSLKNTAHGSRLTAYSYDDIIVEINGIPVPPEKWDITPSPDQHVCVYHALHGGGNVDIGRALLMVAVVIISAYTGQYYGPALAMELGASQAVGVALVQTAAMTAGMMLVNAIAPVPSVASGSSSLKSPPNVYGITGGSNAANKFGPVPVVLGTHRMYPLYGAMPYTEIVGNDEYLRMLFIWGYGPLKIEDIRIGETAITEFTDYEIETVEGRDTDADLTLIPDTVVQESVNIELTYASWRTVVRQAQPGADELSVDISFPEGLARTLWDDSSSWLGWCTMWAGVYYREVGAADWTEAYEFELREKTLKPLRFGYTWAVDRTKTYEVAVTRNATDVDDPKTYDTLYWTNLRSITNEHPVSFPYPLAMTAIRIKATEQLNGVIDSLNGLVSSYATPWSGAAWTGEQVEKNPAALFRMVLMHPANARARTASQIDDATLGAWYTFCDTAGYEFNMVRDAVSSVWQCLADIAAAGRGSPSLSDGTWSVAYDDPASLVAQHITPRNSWGFSSQKVLFTRPHAFRVRFRNEENNYEWDERIVYDDGYDESTATLFESIEFTGVTSPDLAWKWGRYHIAQARLRPEVYTLSMDFERLVCRRGSRVVVSHDVPMWGTAWGRIKSLTLDGAGENVTAVTLDESYTVDGVSQYVIRVRMSDSGNTSLLENITTGAAGEYTTATFETPVALASAPAVGDLCIIGTLGKETQECLVKSITASADLNAVLELVDASPAIYDADTGAIPAFDTNITSVTDMTDIVPGTPSVTAQSGTNTLEMTSQGMLRPRIAATCACPSTAIRIDHYRVRYRIAGSTPWEYAEAPADNPTCYLADVEEAETYTIQAQAISVYGVAGSWSTAISHIVVGVSEAPSDVEYFACNIVSGEAHLSWLPVTDIDLSHYRIRWSPLSTGANWGDCIDVVERVGKPATHISVPAMIGSYLIKAVDYAGNESATATSAATNISHIPGYTNAELLELPDGSWAGTGDGADYDSDLGGIALTLSGEGTYGGDLSFEDGSTEFEDTAAAEWADQTTEAPALAEGTYTFTDGVDLGGVYTSRVYADMVTSSADILSDLYDLVDLYDSTDLYGAVEGACGIDLEMRFTQDDPSGSPTWSDWQRVLVGDYTARAFQFRASLWTIVPTLTPILEAIDIYIDMADRVYPFDQSVLAGGSSVTFSGPFYATPSVGIAVSNGQAGDAYTITGLSRTGFTIAFTNGGSGVARTISGVARGYGEEET